MEVRINKGGIVVNVTLPPDTAAIRAVLETLVAESIQQILDKVTAAKEQIVSEVNKVGDRISTDVTDLQRQIAEGGLTQEQADAFNLIADGLNASAEQLKKIDPLPDFPPAEPAA